MLDNLIIFKNYKELNLDFNNNLRKKDSIMFKDCSNFEIILHNKINKISIINCNNFKLTFIDTISGIDIENSNNIEIKRKLGKSSEEQLTYIYSFRSKITFFVESLDNLSKYKIINELSLIDFKLTNKQVV